MRINAGQLRRTIEFEGKVKACKRLDSRIETEEQANWFVWSFVLEILREGRFWTAATLLFGNSIFDARPSEVRKIWTALTKETKLLVMGCGSVGKSYSIIIYLFLKWLRDCYYTNIKILSATKGHAKANTFSTLVRIRDQCIIPLPGDVSGDYMGLDPGAEKMSGIAVVAIPPGDDGKARLKGFHPQPRPRPDPLFGPSGTVTIFMDECEDTPAGIWEGVDNVLLSSEGGNVQVVGAFNPKDMTSKTASAACPQGGWDAFDLETGVEGQDTWISKEGWRVLRLDGRKSENVVKKKVIFPGFITLAGYNELEDKNGGNTPEYYTLARGAYPPDSANSAIITQSILARSRGEYIFAGRTTPCGGVDTAVDGRDHCVFTRGQVGMAIGFLPRAGDRINFKEPRLAIQADQQFDIKKGDVKTVGDDIIRNAKALGMAPEYLGLDSTGNGAAVHAYVCAMWGNVTAVDFNSSATHTKILEEDRRMADELYDGLVTEVWFALRYWMEFGYLTLASGVRRDPLDAELLGRRYVQGVGKLLRVEKKDDFKKRLSRSPDFADSLTVFLHTARLRNNVMGTMSGKAAPKLNPADIPASPADKAEWLED